MVKGVATSIITVAVLMGSLVACGGTTQVVAPASEPEPTVEETPENITDDSSCGVGGNAVDPRPEELASTLRSPVDVSVLIVDSSDLTFVLEEETYSVGDIAKELILSSQGYNVSPLVEKVEPAETTCVYYTEGYRLEAINIAQALDIETLKVAPMPANPPVNDLGDTHILFHIGIESGDYFMSLIG